MNVVRWPGKRTSGRYVYRCIGGWHWQCDLHGDDDAPNAEGGRVVPTMQEAFAGALAHALVCDRSVERGSDDG